jgi:hypothetical protein
MAITLYDWITTGRQQHEFNQPGSNLSYRNVHMSKWVGAMDDTWPDTSMSPSS